MVVIDLTGPQSNAFTLFEIIEDIAKASGKDAAPLLEEAQSGEYNDILDLMDREWPYMFEFTGDPRKEEE